MMTTRPLSCVIHSTREKPSYSCFDHDESPNFSSAFLIKFVIFKIKIKSFFFIFNVQKIDSCCFFRLRTLIIVLFIFHEIFCILKKSQDFKRMFFFTDVVFCLHVSFPNKTL